MKYLICILFFVIGCAGRVEIPVSAPIDPGGGTLHCLNDDNFKILAEWIWSAEKAIEKYEAQTAILNGE